MEYMLEIAIVVLIIIVMGVLIWFMMRKNEQQKIASHLVGIGYELAKLRDQVNNISDAKSELAKALQDPTKWGQRCYPTFAPKTADNPTNDEINAFNIQLKNNIFGLSKIAEKLDSYESYLSDLQKITDNKTRKLVTDLGLDVNNMRAWVSDRIKDSVTKLKDKNATLECSSGAGKFCKTESSNPTTTYDEKTNTCKCAPGHNTVNFDKGIMTCT